MQYTLLADGMCVQEINSRSSAAAAAAAVTAGSQRRYTIDDLSLTMPASTSRTTLCKSVISALFMLHNNSESHGCSKLAETSV